VHRRDRYPDKRAERLLEKAGVRHFCNLRQAFRRLSSVTQNSCGNREYFLPLTQGQTTAKENRTNSNCILDACIYNKQTKPNLPCKENTSSAMGYK